jgi:acyl-CoA synthetase (NDP forming)
MEDVKRDNPKLLEDIAAQLTNDLNATLQVTHAAKITELETQLAVLNSEKTILVAGINQNSTLYARSLMLPNHSMISLVLLLLRQAVVVQRMLRRLTRRLRLLKLSWQPTLRLIVLELFGKRVESILTYL